MRDNKLDLGVVLRTGLTLLPILFGMPFPAMLWCSFNIAMSYVAYGPITSFVSSLCAVCFSMLFSGIYGESAKLYGLFIALEAILCAWACIYTVVRRKDFFSGMWLCAAGYLVPAVIILKKQASQAGLSIANFLTEEPMEIFRTQFDLVTKDTGLPIDGEFISQLMDTLHNMVIAIVPSVLVLTSVIVGYVVMWSVCVRLRGLNSSVTHSFSEIKIPRAMVIGMIISIVVYAFDIEETVSMVTLNIFVLMMYLCAFAGLSFVDYYLRKAIRITPLRLLIYSGAVMFLSSFIILALTVAGIADSFVDFRKLKNRRQACEAEE